MKRLFSLAILISALLAAASIPSQAQKLDVDVVFIGNSITAGATLADRATQAPPAVAGRALDEILGDAYSVHVHNMGLSGSTTTDWLPTGEKLFAKTVAKADEIVSANTNGNLVFSISLGTNDSARDFVNGPALSNSQFADNLSAIIDSLHSRYPKAQFVLHHLICYSPNTHNSATYCGEGLLRLDGFRKAVSDLVARYRKHRRTYVHLGDTRAWDVFAPSAIAHTESLLTPESGKEGTFFLHPNLMGAQRLGNLWADALAPVIRQVAPEVVSLPSGAKLLLFPAQQADRAVVVCPGGGYTKLATEHEGTQAAAWLNSNDVAAFVLLYRMPNGNPDVPNTDAREALEYVRAHADNFGGYSEVGIMGSSAGGHLASTVATHTALVDFQILLYPVVTMTPGLTHRGSHDRLLGENASDDLVALYSNEKQVSGKSPRAFIALSLDDRTVPALTNGVAYAEALTRAGVRCTLLCYPVGGHGWGFRDGFSFADEWKAQLLKFLKE